ncbi:11002_t:CDS:1 [Ambispora gerdemannii]|uniref:11002_t:CDS:1 n=1 Tax=Ambispora gerdemannii TaxID=144530 RepID=A0A9N8VED5_9GLOM|nr:11002_t:CDS:1 [Ambispora gerdemannii]
MSLKTFISTRFQSIPIASAASISHTICPQQIINVNNHIYSTNVQSKTPISIATTSRLTLSLTSKQQNSIIAPAISTTFITSPYYRFPRSTPQTQLEQRRFRAEFAPRKWKYRKKHKGRVPVRTGGSTKGNYLAFGEYGIRVKYGVRLSSAQLTAAHHVIRRKIKVVKGSKMWMRVFPDIPVTAKGNESRMGKGKGSFEYWACRVPMNKILFEIGGGGIRKEVAKEAMKLAADRLPVKTEFVDGKLEPPSPKKIKAVTSKPSTASAVVNNLVKSPKSPTSCTPILIKSPPLVSSSVTQKPVAIPKK